MTSPLHILHLEDDPTDAELIRATLEAGDFACAATRVETKVEFSELLQRGGFDIILADYTLPSFDGISALKIAQEIRPDVPFIFVSGTLDEEVAIEALKIGATDYVFKTKLSRIVPSVRRALREAEQRTERRRVEEALRRSEAYLAQAQKLSHTGSFGWHVGKEQIYWSEETFRIFELDPAGGATLDLIFERTHPEDRTRVREIVESVVRNRKQFDFEHRLLMPNGRVKWIRAVGQPSRGSEEANDFEFVGAVTDISESKRAEEQLRESQSYLAEAQRLTHTGSWVWRVSDGEPRYLSEEWYRIYGFDPVEESLPSIQKRLQRAHPEDRDRWQEVIRQAVANKLDYDIEYRLLLPDGTIKYLHVVGHPVLNSSGELVEFVGSSTDITRRKLAEEALRRSENYLSEAQRLTHTGSYAWNAASREIVYWSQEIFRLYGFNPEEGIPPFEVFRQRIHPDDRARTFEALERSIHEKVGNDIQFRAVLPDGSIKFIHSVGHAVLNSSGEVAEVIGTNMDVTEERKARDALTSAYEEIKGLRDQLYKENIALRDEVDKASMFEEIVGESPALQAVLIRINKVAPTDSTVLITGETGTGKELVARAIHKRSQRASRAFVNVNCAAIPASLIAAELFGHEKGAFTGALQRRLGRFELAEGGTVFLDEVGELPMETQVALLRILQEREFERVGGTKSLRADVRVIAATNRDLLKAIASGGFRNDLFYRLNVVPVEVPPLRERKEDIRMLVEYFIDRYARKAGKKIRSVEKHTLDLLQCYSWPGNIRELQNVIERSVVISETEIFSVDPGWLSLASLSLGEEVQGRSLSKRSADQEKEIIEAALSETRGRISGPSGAAAQLGMPASTLESKIRALKIDKYRFKTS